MLDAFLEVVHGRTKQAEAEERTRALLSRLPAAELRKIASAGMAVPMPTKMGSGDGCWLDKFRGSPLLDQAIGIEKEELEIQMAENTRRAAQREVTQQFGDWDTDQAARDEISVKRRLLELELAGADMSDEMGGQEGEDAIPPGAAEAPPDTSMDTSGAPAGAIPKPTVENAPPSPDAPEDKPSAGPPEGDGPPASLSQGEEKPKAEKPKTTKITTVEKPTEDKERVDIKAASARMRFSLAVKEASFLDGKADGLGRVGQLLTGSRKKLLEEASGHAKTMFGPNGQHLSDELKRDAVSEGRKVLATRVGAGAVGAGAVGAGAKAVADRKKEAQLANGARPFRAKVASAVTKATGLKRGVQLLTGSRAKALEGQAAARAGTSARNNVAANRLGRLGVFGEDIDNYKAIRNSSHAAGRNRSAYNSSARSTRAAGAERAAVKDARATAGKALVGGTAGVGVGAASMGEKKASAVSATVASGKKVVQKVVDATRGAAPSARKGVSTAAPVMETVAIPAAKKTLSTKAKVIGGSAALGLGAGGASKINRDKTASDREQQIKEAFGAALMQGIKGMGQFAGAAGKSVANAARGGGMQAAGQAAANAGRAGMHRAGQFIQQNPMAGAALVAAPTAAVGYAAGRQ